jgi:hypothetical protein
MEVGLNLIDAKNALCVDGSPDPSWRAIARHLNEQAIGKISLGFIDYGLLEGRTALESRPHKYTGVEFLSPTSICTHSRCG